MKRPHAENLNLKSRIVASEDRPRTHEDYEQGVLITRQKRRSFRSDSNNSHLNANYGFEAHKSSKQPKKSKRNIKIEKIDQYGEL